jgi:ribosome-associated heat shock protein Hsp15
MALPKEDQTEVTGDQRLDRWLWFSRLTKSRTQAADLVAHGKVRINRVRAVKPSQTVKPGDVLTIAGSGKIRIVRVLSTGYRRGPPQEAQRLYEALAPQRAATGGHAT